MSHSKPKILFVLTSHDKLLDGTPTGWYLPELVHPYELLEPHAHIVVASPRGGEAPLDPGSVHAFRQDAACRSFLEHKEHVWKHTKKLSSFFGNASEFIAIFFVGGHGPMFDLAVDPSSQRLIREFFESDKVISALCHASAALIHVRLSDGSYLLSGTSVTGFSNAEEESIGNAGKVPFELETELDRVSGGMYEKAGGKWAPKVTVAKDGRLITGQNPGSSFLIGEAIYYSLFARNSAGHGQSRGRL